MADEQFVLINVFFSKFSTGFMLKKGWKFKLGLATLPSWNYTLTTIKKNQKIEVDSNLRNDKSQNEKL